jgi:hypothetical protein
VFDWLGYFDFLNSRERAVLIWAVLLLVFAVVKADGFGSSLLDLIRVAGAPKLLILFGCAAVYCAIFVLAGNITGLWQTTAVKETVYWFFGTGVVIVGNATQASPDDSIYLKRVLRQALRLTIIVEFLLNAYVFPLAVEVVLMPFVFVFVLMQLMATDEPTYARVRPVIDGVLATIFLGMLIYVAVSILVDLSGFLTRENAENLVVAPALTLALIPFAYLVASYSKREKDRLRRRFRVQAGTTA